MTDEAKIKMMQGILQGANLDHAQINMVVESGATVNYYGGKETGQDQTEASVSNKAAIMEYVGRLKPVVRQDFLDRYDELWMNLLDLKEVRLYIYNKGKQQDTTFNRNLVAQIIHLMSNIIYLPTANTVQMAECLEPGKGVDHPVRQKLGESPDRVIKKAVEAFIKENL